MAAVRGEDLVAWPQGGQGPDDRRFRAIGQMRVAPEQAGMFRKAPLDPFLELPDPQHLREHPDQAVLLEVMAIVHLVSAPPLVPPGPCAGPPASCCCGRARGRTTRPPIKARDGDDG